MASNGRQLLRIAPLLLLLLSLGSIAAAAEPAPASHKQVAAKKTGKQASLDRSGKPRKGRASYYGRKFYGKKMANGKPMNPRSNVAASKTLPLGTKAKVTNLETGKSEVVVIEDRGPYVDGRIIDVSPKTAEKLDLKKEGTAPVQVKPLQVPQQDGSGKSESQAPAASSP
jgi:rare lipoprotein A